MSQPATGTQQPQAPPPYDDEIDLRDLVLVLWRYRWMITGVFVLAVTAAAVLSLVMPKVYQSSISLSVGKIALPADNAADYKAVPLIQPDEAQALLTSPDLRREAGIGMSGVTVKAARAKDSQTVINLTVESADAETVVVSLEKLANAFMVRVNSPYENQIKLLNEQLATVKRYRDELERNGGGTISDRVAVLNTISSLELQRSLYKEASIISGPTTPTSIKPRLTLNVAVAGVLGLMLGVFGAFVLDYFRRNPLDLKGGGQA